MNVLALDLGTHTGWATNKGGLSLGTWDLATDKEVTAWGKTRLTRRGDPRFCRLRKHIAEQGPIDALVFEDVLFGSTVNQAHLWATLRAAIWAMGCDECGLFVQAVPVATLKLFATGHGGAKKEMMMQAAERMLPGRFALRGNKIRDLLTGQMLDDNAIDAFHLLRWAEQNIHLKP